MAEIKWIKLAADIFDNRKIRQIEALPDGDAIIVIWLKLLCLAGTINDGGLIYFTREIPYTEEMIATQFKRPLQTVKLALQVFERFGMITTTADLYQISNWEKYQSIEGLERVREQTRLRNIAYRQRKKEKLLGHDVTRDVTMTQSDALDIEIESESEIKKSVSKDTPKESATPTANAPRPPKPERHQHGEYKNVLLTAEELRKLSEEYPNDYQERIEELSRYMKSTGRVYKDHLATIRNWARRDGAQKANTKQPKQINEGRAETSYNSGANAAIYAALAKKKQEGTT